MNENEAPWVLHRDGRALLVTPTLTGGYGLWAGSGVGNRWSRALPGKAESTEPPRDEPSKKTYPEMPEPGSSVTTAPGYVLKTVRRNGTTYKQWYPTGPRKVSEATRRAELSRESRP